MNLQTVLGDAAARTAGPWSLWDAVDRLYDVGAYLSLENILESLLLNGCDLGLSSIHLHLSSIYLRLSSIQSHLSSIQTRLGIHPTVVAHGTSLLDPHGLIVGLDSRAGSRDGCGRPGGDGGRVRERKLPGHEREVDTIAGSQTN